MNRFASGRDVVQVPNERKADAEGLLDILVAAERGYVPDRQFGNVELNGSVADWAGPKRAEPFVFVICGRNVGPGQFKRCINSLTAQVGHDWGAVLVDDASTNGFGDYAEVLLTNCRDRVTIVRNRTRKGLLYNTCNAIANYCVDPHSVTITLDADDALIGASVLQRLRREYDNGADATVGSMLRMDKEAVYPANFERPRWWTSNVWQHLRTFRKDGHRPWAPVEPRGAWPRVAPAADTEFRSIRPQRLRTPVHSAAWSR